MEFHGRHRILTLTLLPLAGLAACGGKGSDDSPLNTGQDGAGDGNGPGTPPTISLSIDDAEADEGDSGTTPMIFSVSLSAPFDGIFTVAYTTEDGTAKSGDAGNDYQAAEGVLLFEPGTTSQTIQVLVNGDEAIEPHETFSVMLGDPSEPDIEIARAAGQGRIRNDDFYELSVQDVAQLEGDIGESVFEFPVLLSGPSSQPIVVSFATQDASAVSTGDQPDYLWNRGKLIFEPGITQQTIRVRVFGDLESEGDEHFGVVLFSLTGQNVVLADGQATGTILDDDAEIQLDTPSDADAIEPQIARSGDLVCAVWLDATARDADVNLRRSTDGGVTWPDPPVRVDRTPPGVGASGARVSVDGQNVYVVWQDGRDGEADIRFNYSHDGGLTWAEEDLRLDTDAPGLAASLHPRIESGAGKVYVVWEDHRSGVGEIRFNGSHDGGSTWLANDLRLNEGPSPGAPCAGPEIAASGERVYVVWSDERNGAGDIYFDSSLDGGLTWRTADVRLDQDAPGAASSTAPRIDCDGQYVYVTWQDERDGNPDVYFNRSLVGGDEWDFGDRRLNVDPPGLHSALHPRIACSGLGVAVVWDDDRSGLEDVFCSASPDAGFTWWGNVRVSRGGAPGAHRSIDPEVAHGGGTVVVLWRDFRGGEPNLYMNHSSNGGMNFLEEAVWLDAGEPGELASQGHRMLVHGNEFQFVWRSSRASEDVLFRSLSVR